jgi:hypothetical protein
MFQHTRQPPTAATPSDLLVTTFAGWREELGHDIPQGHTRVIDRRDRIVAEALARSGAV